jgi:quercetin dioxygenase-like cupin family protein
MELATIQRFRWDDLPLEAVTDKLSRKVVTGERVMAAHIWLAKGCVVPLHSHEAEQVSYTFSGALKFIIDGETHIVRAGDVLVIPPWVKHEAVALEDTYEMDVFSPIRWDWLEKTDSYFHAAPTTEASFENPASGSNPARLQAMADLPYERLTPFLDRRFLSGVNSTLAELKLEQGCVVPVHQHESEQLTWVRKGRLRLELDGQVHDLEAGSVLRIPSQVPHQATALETCEVIDLFGPRREDWISKTDGYIRQGNR